LGITICPLPRHRHRQIVLLQDFGVHAESGEVSRRREPAPLRILELGIDLLDTRRLVRFGHFKKSRIDHLRNCPAPDDIVPRVALFGEHACGKVAG